MRVVIGVDPGVTGAIAVIKDGIFLKVWDMPSVVVRGKRRQVDAMSLVNLLWPLASNQGHETEVWLEWTHAMPRNGCVASESLGRSKGIVEGIAAALRIPLHPVAPAVWKRSMGLLGKDKDFSRQQASREFPIYAELWSRKCDHNRAEAAMIALYGSRNR